MKQLYTYMYCLFSDTRSPQQIWKIRVDLLANPVATLLHLIAPTVVLLRCCCTIIWILSTISKTVLHDMDFEKLSGQQCHCQQEHVGWGTTAGDTAANTGTFLVARDCRWQSCEQALVG
jgi:hypothetical protein